MKLFSFALSMAVAIVLIGVQPFQPQVAQTAQCHPSYPDFCIPPPPPDLDCKDIPRKNFKVLQPDPHKFDRDKDGIGCESRR